MIEEGKRLCDRCGSDENVETHHFAPQELFDDFNFWPKANLCLRCKTLWEAIVLQGKNGHKDEKYKKESVVKAIGKYERFNLMWLDIIDAENIDKDAAMKLIGECVDEFMKPKAGYFRLGYKIAGLKKCGDVLRKFLLKPIQKDE